MNSSEFLTPQEYADRFKMARGTVYLWLSQGKLKRKPQPPGTNKILIIVTPEDMGRRTNLLAFPSRSAQNADTSAR